MTSIEDISNPCMKCGSIQCAICSEDLHILFIEKQKVNDAINKILPFCKCCVFECERCKLLKELGLDK